MRVFLKLDGVQGRGGEQVGEPLHWPVYFAVDDATLLFLAGDIAASDWIDAPGPIAKSAALSWEQELSARSISPGRACVGYGLLYSAGGAKEASVQAVYQNLVATVQALAIGYAAQASGMGAFLGAFGGRFELDRRVAAGPDFDRLKDGIDPEKLRGEIDLDLVDGLDAFRTVGQALAPLAVGASAFLRGETFVDRAAAPATDRAPDGHVSALAPSKILAVTVQAWRVDDIPIDRPLEIRRALPARDTPRASLKLTGTLRREG